MKGCKKEKNEMPFSSFLSIKINFPLIGWAIRTDNKNTNNKCKELPLYLPTSQDREQWYLHDLQVVKNVPIQSSTLVLHNRFNVAGMVQAQTLRGGSCEHAKHVFIIQFRLCYSFSVKGEGEDSTN